MKQFTVIVKMKSIGIWDDNKAKFRRVDFRAIVDGEKYIYRVVNDGLVGGAVKREAFGRACVAIHYHAKNAGTTVIFEKGDRAKRNPKNVSSKQKEMF